MPGVIAPIYSVGTREVEAGGLPSVPGQDELQNEYITKNKEGGERNRERVRTSLKITETGLTD